MILSVYLAFVLLLAAIFSMTLSFEVWSQSLFCVSSIIISLLSTILLTGSKFSDFAKKFKISRTFRINIDTWSVPHQSSYLCHDYISSKNNILCVHALDIIS